MTNTNDIVIRLRALANALALGEWIALTETCATAADEIETLRDERDEARKLLCDEIWLSRGGRMSVDAIARERGWDWFKEKP